MNRISKAIFTLSSIAIVILLLGYRFLGPGGLGRAEVKAINPIMMDEPAPPFSLASSSGRTLSLKDMAGGIVFLNFWATWCQACIEELPSLARFAAVSSKRNIRVVAASVDDDFSKVREFFKNGMPQYEILHDPGGEIAKAYGTTKYPETYIISPEGTIIAKFAGPRQWDSQAMMNFFKWIGAKR